MRAKSFLKSSVSWNWALKGVYKCSVKTVVSIQCFSFRQQYNMITLTVVFAILLAATSALPLNETLVKDEIVLLADNSSEILGRNVQARMMINYAGPFGSGSFSGSFSDCNSNYWNYGAVSQVNVWSSYLINKIQLRYGATYGPSRGGSQGSRSSITLYDGEYITSAFGRVSNNSYLVSLGFKTSRGRTFGPAGTQQGGTYLSFTSTAPSGKKLVCIEGNYYNYYGTTVVGSITLGWGSA